MQRKRELMLQKVKKLEHAACRLVLQPQEGAALRPAEMLQQKCLDLPQLIWHNNYFSIVMSKRSDGVMGG